MMMEAGDTVSVHDNWYYNRRVLFCQSIDYAFIMVLCNLCAGGITISLVLLAMHHDQRIDKAEWKFV
jgi:hypothetical protein